MFQKVVGIMLAAALVAPPVSAMSVAEFLGRVDAIKANPFTYFSNVGPLKTEGTAAGEAWKAQIAPAGQQPNACPPPNAKKMSNSAFVSMLQAIPPHQRATTSVTQATIAGLNRLYPCKS